MFKLLNKLLEKSNSYNFYKSNYGKLKNQLVICENEKKEILLAQKKLDNSFNELVRSFDELKEDLQCIENGINDNLIQQNITSLKKSAENGRIVNIIFIINFRISVIDKLVFLIEKDPNFNSTILVIPYDMYGINIFDKGLSKYQLQEYKDNYDYFHNRGFNTIKGYDEKNRSLIDIEGELKPDIIFYSTPWEKSFPEQFRIENLPKNILYCYIPYGIYAARIQKDQFNRELHKKAWRIFSETPKHKELATKYSTIGSSNVIVTGYPKMDSLIDGSHEKNPYNWIDATHEKKRVIWAPHHSMERYVNFSTFHKNYEYFYNYAKNHSEIEWVFKPHPNLRHTPLVSSTVFPDDDRFTEEKLEKYYNSWNNLQNATIYEGADYLNLFATSDAMITDSVSFLSEYLYVGKPGLFLTNPKQKFNEYGEMVKKVWYQIDGDNFKEIENFINNVVIKREDPLESARSDFYNRYLNTNGVTASSKIYEYIKRSLGYGSEKN